MPRLPVLALAVLAACASAPRGVPVQMASPLPTSLDLAAAYRPEGQVYAAFGRGAGVTVSYGANGVVGPGTSIQRNREGKWGGTIAGNPVLLEAGDGTLRGAGIDLTVRRDGDALLVSGLWRNTRLDLSFRASRIQGTPGAGCSLDLRPPDDGPIWRGMLACPAMDVASMQLDGAAMELPDVALPQFLLAFLATLPETP
jgi:hypothetical protein